MAAIIRGPLCTEQDFKIRAQGYAKVVSVQFVMPAGVGHLVNSAGQRLLGREGQYFARSAIA